MRQGEAEPYLTSSCLRAGINYIFVCCVCGLFIGSRTFALLLPRQLFISNRVLKCVHYGIWGIKASHQVIMCKNISPLRFLNRHGHLNKHATFTDFWSGKFLLGLLEQGRGVDKQSAHVDICATPTTEVQKWQKFTHSLHFFK